MHRSRWIWLVWLVVLLCYLVPFTFLRTTSAWYGSFLFWTLAGVVVIAVNAYVTGAYRSYGRPDDVAKDSRRGEKGHD